MKYFPWLLHVDFCLNSDLYGVGGGLGCGFMKIEINGQSWYNILHSIISVI